MSKPLTDSRRFYVLMRDAGSIGVHSHDARRLGVSGNPSQRAKDIVSKGVAISTAREARNGRPGSRFWLADHAPTFAHPVRPNGSRPAAGEATPRASSGSRAWVRNFDGTWDLDVPIEQVWTA